MPDADAVVVLSVRGEAHRTVPPDSAVVSAGIQVTGETKAAALTVLAAIQGRFETALRSIGAVPSTLESEREPLVWSTDSLHTYAKEDRHGRATGTVAGLQVNVQIRDLGLLDDVAQAIAGIENVDVQRVLWQVDADNPAWPRVRADAIRAAIAKGRDYAAALGGTLNRIEHVADVGLLGGDRAAHPHTRFELAEGTASMFGDGAAPTLDPAPQELGATIEARFVATAAPLTEPPEVTT